MDLATFLAQVVAVLYLSIGVGMLLDKAHYKKLMDSVMHDMPVLYLSGFVATVAGFTVVTFHNVWVSDWTVLVTIVGWLALVKGVMLLAFPSKFVELSKKFLKNVKPETYSIVVLALGVIFGYFGFVA